MVCFFMLIIIKTRVFFLLFYKKKIEIARFARTHLRTFQTKEIAVPDVRYEGKSHRRPNLVNF